MFHGRSRIPGQHLPWIGLPLALLLMACVPMDPGQMGELALRSAGDTIVARIELCDRQLPTEIIEIELVESNSGAEVLRWGVAGEGEALTGSLEFVVGAGAVGELHGTPLDIASLRPEREYILLVQRRDRPILLNGFRPSELRESDWLTWQGDFVPTSELGPRNCG